MYILWSEQLCKEVVLLRMQAREGLSYTDSEAVECAILLLILQYWTPYYRLQITLHYILYTYLILFLKLKVIFPVQL